MKCNHKVNRKSIRQMANRSTLSGMACLMVGVSAAECIPLCITLCLIGSVFMLKTILLEMELDKR